MSLFSSLFIKYSVNIFLLFRYRNTGIGVCSMMARFGSIITPYIVLLVCTLSLFHNWHVDSSSSRTSLIKQVRMLQIITRHMYSTAEQQGDVPHW